jgi:Spy/CpxP family protein refolding chaperone
VNLLRSALLPAALLAASMTPGVAGAQSVMATPPAVTGQCTGGMHTGGMHGGVSPLRGINLTKQQRQQIRAIHEQFRATYPCGANAQARAQLHQQIMSVLTPAQQAQYQANLQQEKP